MKKTIQKLMAALLAVAMVCAMAIPAFADTENIRDHHSFSAFQIFKGYVDSDNKISNVEWGKNITNPTDFLEKLNADSTIGDKFNGATTVQDVLAVISKWSNSDDNSIAFARFVCHYLYSGDVDQGVSIPNSGDVVQIPTDGAGYYLIVDTTDFSAGDSYHACNSFLLNVTKAPWDLPITPKAEKPSVKKEVFDNKDGTSNEAGFGSSADHAINEPFQFKLTATLPASYDNDRAYDYYKYYKVVFSDTMSEGLTFDEIESVTIKSGSATKTLTDSDYEYTSKPTTNSFELAISDVKTLVANLNSGAEITVLYKAHLNEKAYVNTVTNRDTKNTNKVYLTYSNNPKDESSIGKTPESTPVYVYTYQLNNTKHQDTENGPALAGAGFRLYSDIACNEEQEIKLKQNEDGTYSRDFSTEGKGVEMKSADDGTFNVKGLDAGTYYLKETSTPTGFNTCPVTTVVIKANHTENNVDLNGSTINGKDVGASGLSTTIINIKAGGITLPSTGGIGTTLFYVIGGGLMVAAIVLLVTKKRMENK